MNKLWGLSLAVLALAGCKAKPARIEVEPAALKFHASGDTVVLFPRVFDSEGKRYKGGEPLTFVTTAPLVADVRQDGTVIAGGNGVGEIRVSLGALSATIPVRVSLPSRLKLTASCDQRCKVVVNDPPTITLEGLGASGKLVGEVLNDQNEKVEVDVEYEATDPQFHSGARKLGIEVNKDGEIFAREVGKFVVNATAGSATASAQVEVVLPQVDTVKVAHAKWMKPGELAAVEAKTFRRKTNGALDPVDGAKLSYSSSNPEVAEVDNDGKIKALADGLTQIIAAADGGAYDTMELTVSENPQPTAVAKPAVAKKKAVVKPAVAKKKRK